MLGMPVASLSRAWLAGSGGRLWQARQGLACRGCEAKNSSP